MPAVSKDGVQQRMRKLIGKTVKAFCKNSHRIVVGVVTWFKEKGRKTKTLAVKDADGIFHRHWEFDHLVAA